MSLVHLDFRPDSVTQFYLLYAPFIFYQVPLNYLYADVWTQILYFLMGCSNKIRFNTKEESLLVRHTWRPQSKAFKNLGRQKLCKFPEPGSSLSPV